MVKGMQMVKRNTALNQKDKMEYQLNKSNVFDQNYTHDQISQLSSSRPAEVKRKYYFSAKASEFNLKKKF
jgi:hypothetical protein